MVRRDGVDVRCVGSVRGDQRRADGRDDHDENEDQAGDGPVLMEETAQNPGRRSGNSSGLSPVSGIAVRPTNGSLASGGLQVLMPACSRQADLGVQVGVDDVDHHVDQDEGGRHDQHDTLDLGDVLVVDGLDDVGAEPG